MGLNRIRNQEIPASGYNLSKEITLKQYLEKPPRGKCKGVWRTLTRAL